MRTTSIDAAVTALAARQHGLVTVAQLVDLGLSHAAIRRRIASGRWIKVDRGVIRIAGTPVTWESQVLAAVLAAGPDAVASHRTAAALWELDGCRRGIPELSVPISCWYRRPHVRSHRSTDLDRMKPTLRLGIPLTPVDRTLLDLGGVVPLEVVHVALDHARRRGLTDWDRLLTCLLAHARRGRNGVGTLRALLDRHYGELAVTDTGFERLVCILLLEAGLPMPELQHSVCIDGETYRLDLAYPEPKIAIELDGSIHLRRDVWERDHARQNALILDGWTILRFTWRDYRDHAARLVSEVRAVLRSRGETW